MSLTSCCLILLVNLTVQLLATPIVHSGHPLHLLRPESFAHSPRLLALRADTTTAPSGSPTQPQPIVPTAQPAPLPFSPLPVNISRTEATSPNLELRVPRTRSLSPHHHQKRARSRPLNNSCPPTFHFVWSRCDRTRGLNAYRIGCVTNNPFIVDNRQVDGFCTPDEICVDGVPTGLDEHGFPRIIAYCVSMENFVKIATTQIADGQRKFVYTPWWDRPAYKGNGGRVQVVLGDMEGRLSVYAASMGMRAWNDVPIRDDVPPLRNPLVGGVKGASTCSNCVDLKLDGVPEGTSRVEVDVFLGARTARALLFVLVDGLMHVGVDGGI